jgi:hypothetical protein
MIIRLRALKAPFQPFAKRGLIHPRIFKTLIQLQTLPYPGLAWEGVTNTKQTVCSE